MNTIMNKCEATIEEAPVLLEISEAKARIRFNRPQALNAINVAMAEEFLVACRTIAATPDVRVVILSGSGSAFMAGGDLASFHGDLGHAPQTAAAMIDPLHEAVSLLCRLPQPVIASVHGAVAGAGVSLMLACDLAIAAEGTRFSLAYARIAASIDGSGSWSLPRVVGLRKAMELALLSEAIDASTARSLGMVNQVVPQEALVQETDRLAERLAGGPMRAYARIKELLRSAHLRDLDEQMAAEKAAFCACAAEPDFSEGVSAFFAKRVASFQGH